MIGMGGKSIHPDLETTFKSKDHKTRNNKTRQDKVKLATNYYKVIVYLVKLYMLLLYQDLFQSDNKPLQAMTMTEKHVHGEKGKLILLNKQLLVILETTM